MDWSELYPEFFVPLTQNQSHDDPKDKKEKRAQAQVEFADIGCGYGGLLGNTLALSLGQGEALSSFCHLSRFGGGHSWPFPFGPDTGAVTSVWRASTFPLWPLPWRREEPASNASQNLGCPVWPHPWPQSLHEPFHLPGAGSVSWSAQASEISHCGQ